MLFFPATEHIPFNKCKRTQLVAPERYKRAGKYCAFNKI